MARLGVLDEQQGYRDGPIFLRCPIGSWCASHLAAIGIVARLHHARAHGTRRARRTRSLAQGALVPMAMHWRRVEHAVAVVGGRHAQGHDRRDVVRDRRRRVDPPDGRTDEVADVHGCDRRVVRPDGPKVDPGTLLQQYRRVAGSACCCARAGSGWRTSGRTTCRCSLPRRSARSSLTSRPAPTGTSSRSTIPSSARSRWPARRSRSRRRPACVRSRPTLGAHTDEVLAEWQPQRARGRDGARAGAPAGRSRA